jgi:creatinine amidohydrolase/Fe(II)-dependent formamide hydrolase-like protein/7-cyano-7-deazaguanine synthase in queuosine biosynthesis
MTGERSDGLQLLRAFDRLEIGPVYLEKRRLLAPYRVYNANKSDAIELAYRFEEDVFDPDELASQNLASMLAAQVALNYGLFCDEIVFKGVFDATDRRFIESMARNTAREVFVKKILHPNPFLLPAVQGIAPVKQRSYLRAQLRFDSIENNSCNGKNRDLSEAYWNRDSRRFAVLSSGGKESLLTTGLLKEIGYEVHPVFLNESGRHWFTALNAYRYLSQRDSNTIRVWTNSDRVFAWMLKQLPFVRQDASKIRSDDYPIRLWTVAVFLFGALTLLRKRGIGYLLIGDEYDTTRRATFNGIPHYDGLYDQSRDFDNAVTRYFHAKGWGVCQLSVLRPLSELLVQKMLCQRYSDLQRHQVSCHAAHEKQGRIYPCGRCEKCRRVVSMMVAVGADPKRCGYSQDNIDRCLREMADSGIHQETEGGEHLAHLLKEKGLLDDAQLRAYKSRKRTEVVKLRFDSERSRMEEIPLFIREPLLRIYLSHVEGAVRRNGRVWIDFDPLADPDLKVPYPFEGATSRHGRSSAEQRQATSHLLGELTWPQARKRFQQVDIALLPVGSIEQHGPHLPLDTDAFDADYLAKRVAERCAEPKPFVLPLVPYGVAYHHEDFSGTISIGPETLSRLVYEIGMSAAKHGITKLIIINGHGGNSPALHFAAQMVNRDSRIFTCVDTGETSDPDIFAMAETQDDVHAGEIETSTSLAVRAHLVRIHDAKKFVPKFSSRYLNFSSKRSVGWYAQIEKISPEGVLGDPTKANAEKGRKMWDLMIERLVEFVEDLQGLSLDEIYQRRY